MQALSSGSHLTSDSNHTLRIPIIVRTQTIGMLRLTKPSHSGPWTPEEISEVESLADQLGNTLESARLYNEAQQRATQEQKIGEITKRITSATDLDEIMRETVAQLGITLQDAKVSLRLNSKWD